MMQFIIKRINIVLSIILIAVLYSCEKEEDFRNYTFEYTFDTEEWPLALAGSIQEKKIYVANEKSVNCYHENGVHQVQIMQSNSFKQGEYDHYYIRDIATDLEGNLYILTHIHPENFFRTSVLVFDKKHHFVNELVQSGSGSYYAIEQQDSFLYLGRRSKLDKFNLETGISEEIPLPIWENSYDYIDWYTITDITVGINGMIYIAGMAEIAEDVTGTILSSYNEYTEEFTMDIVKGKNITYVYGSPKANYPGICLASDGSVLLAAYYDKTFHIYDQSLNFIEKIGLNTKVPEIVLPTDILEQNGKVFVLEHFGNKVHVYRKRE